MANTNKPQRQGGTEEHGILIAFNNKLNANDFSTNLSFLHC